MKKRTTALRAARKSKASQSILEVANLRVERGTNTILKDIAWRVERKQHWVILGPNGCGKTTLLRSLVGYMSPTVGDIAVLGRRYGECDWRELRFSIGIVTSALQASIPPAEPALETVISGKYAQLDLWVKTTPADEAAAFKLMRTAGIAYLAKREWVFLSQGERQRVLIARALMARPRLLILDEPCSGLDPVAREYFLKFIEKLAHQPGCPALVLVTHHVEEITPAFTHALLLRSGEVAASGPLAKTLNDANLSHTFGVPIKLSRVGKRWQLRFATTKARKKIF